MVQAAGVTKPCLVRMGRSGVDCEGREGGCEQRSSEPGSGEASEKGVCLRIKAHRVHPLCTRTKDEGAPDPAHRRANFLFAPVQDCCHWFLLAIVLLLGLR